MFYKLKIIDCFNFRYLEDTNAAVLTGVSLREKNLGLMNQVLLLLYQWMSHFSHVRVVMRNRGGIDWIWLRLLNIAINGWVIVVLRLSILLRIAWEDHGCHLIPMDNLNFIVYGKLASILVACFALRIHCVLF